MFYRTSALWGRCPAPSPQPRQNCPSRATGTADHVRSLDDLLGPVPCKIPETTLLKSLCHCPIPILSNAALCSETNIIDHETLRTDFLTWHFNSYRRTVDLSDCPRILACTHAVVGTRTVEHKRAYSVARLHLSSFGPN